MTKRLCLSTALAVVAILLVVMPVLAAYYAYIYVEESAGNSYDELAIVCPANITRLLEGDFITSTGLDTRVLTGSGEPLPHMIANDKVLFVSDLAAYEDKTLIFYLGATSLSSFPIVVGYNGSFETPDDSDLELGYVMELLVSGYFDAAAGSDKNILYKEDAFRMWISAANTLKVATYNSTGDEQWEMHYSNFTTEEHTVYICCDFIYTKLYVDGVLRDSEALYDTHNSLLYSGTESLLDWGQGQSWSLFSMERRTFYANGRYWAFYLHNSVLNTIYYRTSTDGVSWDVEQFISIAPYSIGATYGFSVWQQQGTDYFHIVYGVASTQDFYYRRGYAESDGSITWSAVWQQITWASLGSGTPYSVKIATNKDGYPFIAYIRFIGGDSASPAAVIKSSTNNGTWTTEGGYPVEWAGGYGWFESAAEINIIGYPNSNKMYVVWGRQDTGPLMTQRDVYARYYNGATWAGSSELISDGVTPDGWLYGLSLIADNDDNVYICYSRDSSTDTVYLRIRYSDGSFSSPITLATGANDTWDSVSYDPNADIVYFFYISGGYIKFRYLVLGEATLNGPYDLCTSGWTVLTSTPYGANIGILFQKSGEIDHVLISPFWTWNENNYDWYWNQNNVCPYIDDIQFAVDGILQLEYKPASIIQGTTLPDEEEDHDAIITWGSNPSGVNVTMSELQIEQSSNQTYYYQNLIPGTTDIIKPEPATMTGDVDVDRLHDNPMYPLVQILAASGEVTERLAWLLFGWFIVIAAMLVVHLGIDTHPDAEKPQHFILTSITGLGLCILFYTMGIFPFWVIVLMAFGLVGAIIWERQPVL